MIIAIHHRQEGYSARWIEYCRSFNISYKLVDCHGPDIIKELKGCSGLLWHWSHTDPATHLFAKQLIYAIEKSGIKVFPNLDTSIHFDDKIAQAYLFQALKIPHIETVVLYDRKRARAWAAANKSYPFVFKLSGGAGSANVKLVKNHSESSRLINKAFGKGFGRSGRFDRLLNRFWIFQRDKNIKALLGLFKGFYRSVIPTKLETFLGKDKGYVYFQAFAPNNEYDTRVIVIGDRIFAIRRFNRKNDFRASGSGVIDYDHRNIKRELLKYSIVLSETIGSQCIACDYIYLNTEFKLVEISYGFAVSAYDQCPGYWDKNLNWHSGEFNPQWFIIEDLINSIQ